MVCVQDVAEIVLTDATWIWDCMVNFLSNVSDVSQRLRSLIRSNPPMIGMQVHHRRSD